MAHESKVRGLTMPLVLTILAELVSFWGLSAANGLTLADSRVMVANTANMEIVLECVKLQNSCVHIKMPVPAWVCCRALLRPWTAVDFA